MKRRHKSDNVYNNLENNKASKKYIEEMHKMADNNEKRSNVAFLAVVIPIAIALVLIVVQVISFSVNLAKEHSKKIDNKSVVNETSLNNDTTKTNSKVDTNNPSSQDLGILNENIYTYLKEDKNRTSSFNKAKSLNSGNEKGLSSIFIAQVLRDNHINMPKSIINTSRLVSELKKQGFEKVSDYKKLEKGDICFASSSSSKAPAHVYIFMGWVKEGKTDYAYIVDSQVSEYKNTLHKRNIDFSTPKKDKFGFFMRKK